MTKSELKIEAERLRKSGVRISNTGIASRPSMDIIQSDIAREQISAFRKHNPKKVRSSK